MPVSNWTQSDTARAEQVWEEYQRNHVRITQERHRNRQGENMTASTLTEADTRRARELWEDYQQAHDVSDRLGQAVGIDPFTGDVWFGESASDILDELGLQGLHPRLLFTRVGERGYVRKGGHR